MCYVNMALNKKKDGDSKPDKYPNDWLQWNVLEWGPGCWHCECLVWDCQHNLFPTGKQTSSGYLRDRHTLTFGQTPKPQDNRNSLPDKFLHAHAEKKKIYLWQLWCLPWRSSCMCCMNLQMGTQVKPSRLVSPQSLYTYSTDDNIQKALEV